MIRHQFITLPVGATTARPFRGRIACCTDRAALRYRRNAVLGVACVRPDQRGAKLEPIDQPIDLAACFDRRVAPNCYPIASGTLYTAHERV
jgi:hypothetical protein